ncbi:MAG: RelA/SpoT domain-containing protein, partial [Algicola sp.]|nr:RelA/SpoT domain-containing protein [Algicola sp.]
MVNEQYQQQKNTVLAYSKKAVKKAGDHIRKGCDAARRDEAINIIRNFRESHLYPLMLIKNHVNRMALKVSDDFILARRLKRLPTILDKLERTTLDGQTTNAIQLTRMQDIGGCRVIFETVEQVYDCLQRLQKSRSVHRIVSVEDRMFDPKPSGYRGVHVVFSCYDNDESSTSSWRKHKIELQLRTRLQHAWATCVETIDVFEQTRLKTRLEGDGAYREFFKLASNLMAEDEKPAHFSVQQCHQFRSEMKRQDISLNFLKRLEDYRIATNVVGYDGKDSNKLDGQILVSVNKMNDAESDFTVTRKYFSNEKRSEAVKAYNLLESDNSLTAVVLVSVKSVTDLKKAYPNYFIDTRLFQTFFLRQMGLLNTGLVEEVSLLNEKNIAVIPSVHTSGSLTLKKPVSTLKKPIELNAKSFFANASKALAKGVTLDFAGAGVSILDILADVGLKDKPGEVAWVLIYQSLMLSVAELVHDSDDLFDNQPTDEQKGELSKQLTALLSGRDFDIDVDFFNRPQGFVFLDTFKPYLKSWLIQRSLNDAQAEVISERLADKFALMLHNQWLEKPDDYACIKSSLDTPFTRATLARRLWLQYNAWLNEQVNERMFHEAFSLKQIYVKPRAYYTEKLKTDREDEDKIAPAKDDKDERRVVVDLHKELIQWAQNFSANDAFRVISGGPCSGKTAVSKMLAAELA